MINHEAAVIMPVGTMSVMATPPESTKISLGQRLAAHAAAHWPQAGEMEFRYRGAFVYVEAHLPDGAVQPLIRLRCGGSARRWGCGIYLASSGKYEDQILPSGLPTLLKCPTLWVISEVGRLMA